MEHSIGGYFELELQKGEHYHQEAIKLNTARNCLEYILRVRNYNRVYIPFYTCEVLIEPFHKLNIPYRFYHINEQFELADQVELAQSEAILYTNYFGLKQTYIEQLAKCYGNQLIVDNAQAFFAPRIKDIDTFYSARKFFGVSDGAYLYTDMPLNETLPIDKSLPRSSHLLVRIEEGAESGYPDFQRYESELCNQPIKQMSRLTQAILCGVNYKAVAERRLKNFQMLNDALSASNKVEINTSGAIYPMVYPYRNDNSALREQLIKNKIFVARYWPNVTKWCDEKSIEYAMANSIIPIPIDQRYDFSEMSLMVDLILSLY